MTNIRVGVVGLGWFGRIHIDAWRSVHGADVVGVCDTDTSVFGGVRKASQAEFHADAGGSNTLSIPSTIPCFSSLDELIASGIDLLDVVVTEDQHENCVRSGIGAGVDVLVEKPLALSLDGAEALFRLAQQSGCEIFVGQILRFDPRHVALREMVSTRDLRHLSFSRHFQASAHQVYGRVHPVLNAAIHDIDLAIWMVGTAPKRVSAFSSHFFEKQYPDCVDLVLEWDGGIRAIIQNSWHLAAGCPYGFSFECNVQVAGTSYMIRNEPVLEVWSEHSATAPEMFLWPRYAGARAGALVAQLQHIAECVAKHEESKRITATDVMEVMRTCQAAIDALTTGSPQTLRQSRSDKGISHA